MKYLKYILITLFTLIFSVVFGQTAKDDIKTRDAIGYIKYVFDDYIKYQESTDSNEDKLLMTRSLESLHKVSDPKALEILINVWMYYDPTDFPSNPLILDILKNSKPESIKAVEARIRKKKKWERDNSAPYSELKDLLELLNNTGERVFEKMQGVWIHHQDSLAFISIINHNWTFNYEEEPNNPDNNFYISITNKLPEFVKETEKSEFLILTNKNDTLKYEILTLTDSILSLMYFPNGKIQLYKRQK